MRRPAWLRDTITRRFALAIAAAGAAVMLLNLLVDGLLGGPAFPPPVAPSLLEQLPGIIRSLNAAPPAQRAALAEAAVAPDFQVDWQRAAPGHPRLSVGIDAGGAVAAPLDDGTWLVFTPLHPRRGIPVPNLLMLRIGILLACVLVVSLAGAARLARPIEAFASAARRFGSDPNARPMDRQGPAEMQAAIDAFNAMQARIQRFVAGQAAMFAAMSHDLRTPLTRMRLRGEFIDDPQQQARLFRDVDEMQTMVTAALSFLRDNAAEEATTRLDLAELLRSIADDHADAGTEVTYSGPQHVAFPGRPIGLRRAFGNLVDNAVKYGTQPTIDLALTGGEVRVTIGDDGPGIPADMLEDVFMPFHRLERSRNRDTGGMGLGLTAARAGFRAHGGDVVLTNAVDGGLRATVVLPLSAPGRLSGDPVPADTTLAPRSTNRQI